MSAKHPRLTHWMAGGLLAATLAVTMLVVGAAKADSATWTQGSLPVMTLGEPTDGRLTPTCAPSSITYSSYTNPNGTLSNTIREINAPVCATSNSMGQFANLSTDGVSATSFEFIKPNSAYAYRVLDPTGRQKSIMPVPNQKSAVYNDPIGLYGATALRFIDSFSAHGTFGVFGYGSGTQTREIAYKFDNLPAVLRDTSGNPIAYHGFAFSNNGRWMVVESGHGMIRIDTQSREMLLFSKETYRYDLGFAPSVRFAVSDDGNTVIQTADSYVKAYDLSGCAPAPIHATPASNLLTGCVERNLSESVHAQAPGFRFLFNLRFNGDGKSLTGKIAYDSGGSPSIRLHKYFTYNVAGYQVPKTAYLALGDSFSSGEGAYDYELGTDETNPHNKCHLSRKSYPYLTARELGLGEGQFHSVACSGAKMVHYTRFQEGQNEVPGSTLGDWLPGFNAQSEYFTLAGEVTNITISMIGNDIGFSDKIRRCLVVGDACYHFREDRLGIVNEINAKSGELTDLYRSILRDSNGARVYVLGYPQMFSTADSCGNNVWLDAEERAMSRGLVSYLNAVVKVAAANTGVKYIDVENAFAGHQLCDPGSTKAVNGMTGGNEMPEFTRGPIGTESFHPNAYGHQLLAQALMVPSANLTAPMPSVPTGSNIQQMPSTNSAVYSDFVSSAPSGNRLERAAYVTIDFVSDVVYRAAPVLNNAPDFLKPNGSYEFWFHSTPTYAGSLTTNAEGRLQGTINVPAGLEPGWHTLHIYGQNAAGESLDMSRTVYVAHSQDDLDGDGVLNQDEACAVGEASGVDRDRDGIDDACDGEIGEAPADTTPPTVTSTADREANPAGWYNADVTITWNSTDPEPSSGQPTQPPATHVTAEGAQQYTSQPSCDPAGNCASGSYTVKLDKSEPLIDVQLDRTPSADGWFDGPVTVTFVCSDAISGIAVCPEPETVTDGSRIVTGYALDNAGNSAGINVIVAIDTDRPTANQSIAPAANSAGWHNSGVTVMTECDDATSGVTRCSPLQYLDGEGANQLVSSIAVDRAGNMAETTTYINIDKTAPSVGTLAWTLNPKATNQTSLLTVPVSDNLSGVTAAEYFLGDTDPGQGNGATMAVKDGVASTTHSTDFPTGVYKISVRVRDHAGNWSVPSSDYLVVYNPTGTRMTGKRTLTPSLANGDVLPGLASGTQTDAARFGFNVWYDKNGQIHPQSDLQFSYHTGANCNKPAKAVNCHNFDLNSSGIAWLATQGTNDSTGIFQGTARLVIDGDESSVIFRVSGLDGERLDAASSDRFSLRVFRQGDNPNTSQPIYHVDGEVERGNIRIKVQ